MKPSDRIYEIIESDYEWHDRHTTSDRKLEMKIDAIVQYLDELYEEKAR